MIKLPLPSNPAACPRDDCVCARIPTKTQPIGVGCFCGNRSVDRSISIPRFPRCALGGFGTCFSCFVFPAITICLARSCSQPGGRGSRLHVLRALLATRTGPSSWYYLVPRRLHVRRRNFPCLVQTTLCVLSYPLRRGKEV